ncbi:protein of unknown function [Candidatus Methylomirabilis oxygeniifera]|uniref:Uncharacterized protein n=1 Tax=Methylomirabilis oxygeniifera TaxID=671143 RepID=D5MGW6_METO1|nr:protein of unknown function [Candidatus Methylomirabilis oxyfera]
MGVSQALFRALFFQDLPLVDNAAQ